jgi:hypothetical protein
VEKQLQKSAEAVVVRIAMETWKERRAEYFDSKVSKR